MALQPGEQRIHLRLLFGVPAREQLDDPLLDRLVVVVDDARLEVARSVGHGAHHLTPPAPGWPALAATARLFARPMHARARGCAPAGSCPTGIAAASRHRCRWCGRSWPP